MSKVTYIVNDIMNKIHRKEYLSTDKIPPERTLAENYKVSRHTIREALKKLESYGYIYKIQGSGIFISDSIQYNALIYNSLIEKKHSEIYSQVLFLREILADEIHSDFFSIPINSKLWEYKRIRFVNYRKTQIEHTIIPQSIIPELNKKIVEGSIHTYINNNNHKISHFVTEYTAINMSKEDAELLNCKKGIAATKIKNRGYLENNTVFEISESINLDYKCAYINKYNDAVQEYRTSIKEI